MRTRPEDTELLSFRDLLVRFIASLLHGVCVCAVYQVETDLHAAHALELNIDFENRGLKLQEQFDDVKNDGAGKNTTNVDQEGSGKSFLDLGTICPEAAPEVVCLDLTETSKLSPDGVRDLQAHLLSIQQRHSRTHREAGAMYSQGHVLRFSRPSRTPGSLNLPAEILLEQALENIHRAADEAALDRGWGMQLESNQNQSEELQTVTYIPGGFYSSHVDTVGFDGELVGVERSRQRLVTVLVQLSTGGVDYQGGQLQVQLKNETWIDAPSKLGSIILFPSHLTKHRVMPVTSGHRYVLVWWLWGYRIGGAARSHKKYL
mmetsp:Transcript_28291/g.53518  ORF Transcript_28291/g.53518 Transcript_28291/m.53518 type:complete len:318 (+) Transcript_28291:32-985(+)